MTKTHFGYEQVEVDDKARRVRGVFDPGWLLNPAKVFPLEGRFAA